MAFGVTDQASEKGGSLPQTYVPKEQVRISCYFWSFDSAAGCAHCCPTGMEATFEKKKYWQIAKPLVDELCSQWVRDRERTACTVEALLAYLRNMYEAFLPNMALFPETANPLHYVKAIENHLSDSVTADVNGTPAALPAGVKRKRELHEGLSGGDENQANVQTRQRLEGPASDNSAVNRDLHYLQQPGPSLDGSESSANVDSNREMLEPEASDLSMISSPNDFVNNNESQGESVIDNVGCAITDGSESSNSPASDSVQDSGCWDPTSDVAFPNQTSTPERAGAAFDHMLAEFSTSSQVESPTTDNMLETDNMSPVASNALFVPYGAQGSDGQTQPSWVACQMPSMTDTSTAAPLPMLPDLSSAEAEGLVSSWSMPENISQAIMDTFPTALPTPFTHDSISQATDRGETDQTALNLTNDTVPPPNIGKLCDNLEAHWTDESSVSVYGGQLTRTDVRRLLQELQDPGCLSSFSVNILGNRLACRHQTQSLYIGHVEWQDHLHRESLRLSPLPPMLLLPGHSHGQWSLIEVQTQQCTITHYLFPTSQLASSDLDHHHDHGCSACQAAAEAVTRHLRKADETILVGSKWQFNCRPLQSGQEGGILLLWAMAQRADGQPAHNQPPETFRSGLAQAVATEVLQCRTDPRPSSVASREGVTRREVVRRRWSTLAGRCGAMDLTATWEQIAQRPLGAATAAGWERADQLLQLSFNIASPPVLVEIQRQLLHLRTRRDMAVSPFVRNAAGVFEAGLWHKSNEHSSRIGLALTCWYIHDHRQQLQQEGCPDPMGQTVSDIFHQLPEGSWDYRQVEERVRDWYRRAWPWAQLVRIAGSPNVLCFLPQGVGYFSDEDGSSMTDYRTLKKAEFEVLEAVIQQFRPLLLAAVPPTFFEIFLYNRLPASRFAMEEWTEREILSEPLDSRKFEHAFDLMTEQGN
ncbi:uncharacterized protein ATNIH1004_001683 [Aspergillus tanneri]|uniref:Uncharacterized protein n=1 Tax=Aspergillus tanneri TaxID=1220188 RepID=A0A5M9N107_9EURO|nr:uncharacterized protein ATNIH1004_001683 [Aspergillus tanneri]KAA8652778.1 hypothetical protein ATNIH1004_001683 [Aspergillus tanneri]